MLKILNISFLLYSLVLQFQVSAQENGKLLMQIYADNEYDGSPQNWAIIEDNRSILYVANQSGNVLEFDGTNWKSIPISNNSSIRSLAKGIDGRIYVGGTGEFGYLAPDVTGTMKYHSLTFLLDSINKEFNEIWSINVLNDKVFFNSRKKLFLYDQDTIIHWDLPDTYHRNFIIDQQYYIRQENIGLTVLENDTFLLINDGALFANEYISAMMPFSNNEILIGTRNKGLYLFNKTENVIKKFINEANNFLSQNKLYHGVKIGKDQFAFATLRNGIIIIEKSGKITRTINKTHGLPSNTTYFIHNQNDQYLWVVTQSQIARIDIGYPFEYWDDDYGFDGTIYNIERVNETLYLATGQSLYYWPPITKSHSKTEKFNNFKNIKEVVWFLLKYKPPCDDNTNLFQSFAGTTTGIYKIESDQATLLYKTGNSYIAIAPERDINSILFASEKKVYQIQYDCNTGKWSQKKEILSLPGQIIFMNEDHDHNIWIYVAYNGYYRLTYQKISDPLNKPFEIKKYTFENGLPNLGDISIHKLNNDMVFLSDSGMHRFNKETEHFYSDTFFNKQLSNLDTYRLVQDDQGNIWIDGDELFIKQNDSSYINDTMRFKRLQIVPIYSLFSENNGDTWFGGKDLYKTNLKDSLIIKDKYTTLIRSVVASNDSLLFGGTFFNDSNEIYPNQTDLFKPELDYKYNSISFEFSAPYFVEQEHLEYSYMLEGFDKSWSGWSVETKKEYTNLNEGRYIFKVKANCVFDIESDIASFEFVINPPWQRSVFAYILYVILSILLIIIIINIYTKRLKRANIRLENIVKERTAVIREKNKELAKLSIVASETENAIAILDTEGNFEWINDGFTRLHGYTLKEYIEVIGHNLIESSKNPDIKILVTKCIKEKIPVIYQSLNISKSKEKIWTQTTLTPILDENNNLSKLVTIEADIRKIKEYEREINEQKEEIAAQRDELVEANATKDKFFSIISHDLKSPFNSILGFSEMLSENISAFSNDKIAKFSEQIYNSSKQLYALVENLLSWSRTKSNKIINIPEKININELIDKVTAISKISAKDKSIKISQKVQKNIYAFADTNLVATILRNLLSNAIKYSKENGLIIIKAGLKSKFIEIAVIDSGIGIKKEDINKLFKENIHYTTKGTNQEKGTGLGLILCKNFVGKCGGKIWVESEERKGTTFAFTIPKYKKASKSISEKKA